MPAFTPTGVADVIVGRPTDGRAVQEGQPQDVSLENGPNTAYSSQVKDALANARADAPDFHVDLGDTFMTDKHGSREDAAR